MIIQILATLSAAAGAATPSVPDEAQVTQFPASYVTPIRAALTEFKKTHANWTCFRVIVVPQVDRPRILQIGFSSDSTVSNDRKNDSLTIGPPQKCGPGASYLVRFDGTILQRIGRAHLNNH